MKTARWIAATLCLGLTGPLFAAPAAAGKSPALLTGTVSQVNDGDSLVLSIPDKPPVTVRLRDVDAPEICQVYGVEARQALAALALNQPATLKPAGRDEQGRTMGRVTVAGVDLSVRLVEEGHAWSTRTKWDQGPLVKQERMARSLGRGLHAQGGAVMPRDFRRAHGPCAR